MTKNIGSADKIIRFLIALIIGVLYFTNVLTGTIGIIMLVIGGILAATALINFCPIWAGFGMKTTSSEEN
jgi:pilus assembly protein TadC